LPKVEAERVQPIPQPEPAPAQSWDSLSNSHARPNAVADSPSPAQVALSKPEADDAAAQQASRLSGLRDLLSALHQKNLQRGIDFGSEAPMADAEPPREEERIFYPRSSPADQERPPVTRPAPTGAPQRQVVAQPEFLPPRAPEETTPKSGPKESAATRRDRRDSFDEVAILPSWRGQYKKKNR